MFAIVSIVDILSGAAPLIVDVRQTGSGSDDAHDCNEDWADWSTAKFEPLNDSDPGLAEELGAMLVDEFLTAGQLSDTRKEQALAQLRLLRGVTRTGVVILAAELPLGSGRPEYEWDGDPAEARAIVRSMGEAAGRTITAERARGAGDTGWELRFDGGTS